MWRGPRSPTALSSSAPPGRASLGLGILKEKDGRLCHRRVTPSFRRHCAPPIFLETESLLFETPCGRFPSGGVAPIQSSWRRYFFWEPPPMTSFRTSRQLGCLLWRIHVRQRQAPQFSWRRLLFWRPPLAAAPCVRRLVLRDGELSSGVWYFVGRQQVLTNQHRMEPLFRSQPSPVEVLGLRL